MRGKSTDLKRAEMPNGRKDEPQKQSLKEDLELLGQGTAGKDVNQKQKRQQGWCAAPKKRRSWHNHMTRERRKEREKLWNMKEKPL